MTNETKSWTFKQEDIFQEIPGDPQNLNFTIPPEIMEAQGWKEGDPLKISWGDQGSIMITKLDEMPKETD
jgi:hypothetical protein